MRSFQDLPMRKLKESRKTATGSESHSEKMASKSPEISSDRSSPDPNCSICLSKMKDKSFTDRCFHMFCFECLVEWSKINAVCPLCKQSFKQIFHNIRSMSDYDVYDVMSHSSILPLVSSLSSVASSNVSQPLLTNSHDVRLFLSQASNEAALSEWLNGHIQEFIRVDALQAAYISNFIIDQLRVWCISSQQFYDSLSSFFTHHTLDFIHSLDHHLRNFIRQESREHTLEVALQRMRSRVIHSSSLERNPILNVPAMTVHHRATRNSTTSRYLIDGVLRSSTSNPPVPETSRFSVLFSIIRPSMGNRGIHAGSSSSSSPPREDELIDIEQLDESHSRSRVCKSPICVSSGDEGHVQLVECSSKTKPHHLRKRKQQTFLLVSSDDESSSIGNESAKRMKMGDRKAESKSSSNAPLKPNNAEVKVTFKKHPTGHKNSFKCKTNVLNSRNEKSNEEEKSISQEAKVEGESANNPVIPGSSSSQNVVDAVRTNSASPSGRLPKKEEQISSNELKLSPNPGEEHLNHEGTFVILDDSHGGHQGEGDVVDEDMIDIDTISVYSDDSIEWLEDVSSELHVSRKPGRTCKREKDVEVMEMHRPEVVILTANSSSMGKACEHLFVDLSDDADSDGTRTSLVGDQNESVDVENERSGLLQYSKGGYLNLPNEGCSTSQEGNEPSAHLNSSADSSADNVGLGEPSSMLQKEIPHSNGCPLTKQEDSADCCFSGLPS